MSKYITKTCPVCGKEFTVPSKNGKTKTCSRECRYISSSRTLAVVNTYTTEQASAAFWAKVSRSSDPNACWEWTGYSDKDGYGLWRWQGKTRRVNRISYEIAHGSFDESLQVLHSCDTPRCLNPSHLFLGTQQDNMDDMIRKHRENPPRGERNAQCKLTDTQVAEIRRKYAEGGVFQRELAAEFGVSASHVSGIVRRDRHARV